MDNNNKQEIIDEYNQNVNKYNNLRDDITNLEKSISDMKANIKQVLSSQESLKQQNYNVWQQLDCKNMQPKATEQKEPSIGDILEALK